MPDDHEPADGLVQSLTTFDDLLRSGEFTFIAASSHFDLSRNDKSKPISAEECLVLLEQCFPRGGDLAIPCSDQRIGRFELIRILGQGGFGTVYLAKDSRLGRLVALKIPRLHALGNRTLHERFLRESRAAAALDHPNILPILEAGEEGMVCYIASAYCEGTDLEKWVKIHAPVVPRLAARIVKTLAEATHYSHMRGILHRDLKPSNVLLGSMTTAGEAKADELPFVPRITDFGLARFMEDAPNETGSMVMGTPLYMAPEQAAGQNDKVSAATDVYALGAILYELLTGRPPFQGTSSVEVIDQIRSVDPVPPSRLVKSVKKDLETVCLKCLHKLSARRYQTSGALADDLAAYLEGRAISARPVGVVETAVKWIRRRPTAAVLIGMSTLLIVALVLLQWRHGHVVEANLQTTLQLQKAGLEREKKLRFQLEVTETEAGGSEVDNKSWQAARQRWKRLAASAVPGQPLGAEIEPEWNYVWNHLQVPAPTLSLSGHKCPVYSVAISPNGAWIASGDERGIVRISNRESGNELTSFKAHDGEVRALSFSPDSKTLATGGQFHIVRIWRTGKWDLRKEFDAHDGTTTCLHFGATGATLASGGRDGFINLWDTKSWTKKFSIAVGDVVNKVILGPDDRSVFSTDKGRRISVWRWRRKAWKRQDLGAVAGNPLSLAVTADGRFGFAPSSMAFVHFDTELGKAITLPTATPSIAACMSHDGSWGVVAGSDGEIQICRFETRNREGNLFHCIAQQSFVGHDQRVNDVTTVPGREQFVTASHDGTLRIWSLDRVRRPSRYFLPGHEAPVKGVAFSHDSSKLATCSDDGRLRLYSSDTFELTSTLDWKGQCRFLDVYFAPDNRSLIVRSDYNGGSLVVWDPKLGTSSKVIPAPHITATAQSPDRRWLASVQTVAETEEQRISLWDLENHSLVRTLAQKEFGASCLRFSGDGRKLAIGGQDLQLLDLASGSLQPIELLDGAHLAEVAFNPMHGEVVACGYRTIWRTDSGFGSGLAARPFLLGLRESRCRAIDVSPDGRVAAVAIQTGETPNGSVIIWNFRAEQPVLLLEPFHNTGCIRFSPDGRFLAAGMSSVDARDPGSHYTGVFVWRFDYPHAPPGQSTTGVAQQIDGRKLFLRR